MVKRQRPAIHPGKFLLEEMEARSMTVDDLARASCIPPEQLSAIVAGDESMTVHAAERVAAWIGSSPEYWLNLQHIYDLRSRQSASPSF